MKLCAFFYSAALFFTLSFFCYAQVPGTSNDESTLFPLSFKSIRANALGGNHAALADDFDTLYVNPAGLSSIENLKSFGALWVTVNDVDSIFNLISSEKKSANALADIVKNRFSAGFDITFPFFAGYIADGFGMGLLNHQYAKIWWDRNQIVNVNANIVEEIAFIAGRSWPIENAERTVTITPGFSAKPMIRLVFTPRNMYLTEFRYVFENLKGETFEFQPGIGFDGGLLINFSDVVYFGAVVHDIITPLFVMRYDNFDGFANGAPPNHTGIELIKPTFDFSFCLRTRDTFLSETVSDIVITADYHGLSNILYGIERSPLLDIGIGLEISLVRALWLRLGWQNMMPGGGIGLDLGWSKFDVAVFGETFGFDIDAFKSLSVSIGFSFKY